MSCSDPSTLELQSAVDVLAEEAEEERLGSVLSGPRESTPEASPGPRDSHYLFKRFVDYMEKAKR